MQIKEVRYGMSLTINTGNYENVKIHLELAGIVEENDNITDTINSLKEIVRKECIQQYKSIKNKQ